MTDYRRTEQELWEEDAIAEEDHRAQVVPKMEPVNDATPSGRSSLPPDAGARDSIDSVTRFIADASLLAGPSSERSLDAPSRSLAALQLLDAEDLDDAVELTEEPAPTRARPPALPSRPPPPPALPSVLLGPPISTRDDATERVTTIPKTHPLANSLAPGGSPTSLAPRPLRRSLRIQVALGAVALLALGASASRFLQSRGEHHALSGARAAAVDSHAPERPQPSLESPSPDQPSAQERATPEGRRDEGEASGLPASPSSEPTRQHATSPSPRRPDRPAVAADAPTGVSSAQDERGLRVAVGAVQLAPGAAAAEPVPVQPDRMQVIAALNALTEKLRACVGDEHGIADVTLTVRAPGVVSHALVEGSFAGSDKGSCIARMLHGATLPRFSEPVVRIEYPFEL